MPSERNDDESRPSQELVSSCRGAGWLSLQARGRKDGYVVLAATTYVLCSSRANSQPQFRSGVINDQIR